MIRAISPADQEEEASKQASRQAISVAAADARSCCRETSNETCTGRARREESFVLWLRTASHTDTRREGERGKQ